MNSNLIEQWNENIPLKISESELARPTEKFLTQALIALLESMNIKNTWTLDSQEHKHILQIRKAKLAKFVDKLYKVADPKNTFCYVDLVQPVSKKTCRVLQFLLNHFFYYKMMKEEIRDAAVSLTEQWDQLQTEINEMTIAMEKTKMRAERLQSMMEQHKNEISTLSKYKTELEGSQKAVESDLAQNQHMYDEMSTQHRLLVEKIEHLKTAVVDDAEADNLLLIKSDLEQRSLELKEAEDNLNHRILENCRQIEEMRETTQKIEQILGEFGVKVKSINKMQEEISKIESEHEALIESLNEVEATIQIESARNKENNELYGLNQKQLKAKIKAIKKEVTTLKNQVITNDVEYEKTLVELKQSENLLQSSKDEITKVLTIGQAVIEKMQKMSFN